MVGKTPHEEELAAQGHAAEVIQGLENLAAFLRAHPDLPLYNGTDPLHIHVTRDSDEEERAEVDRIAVILGVTAEHMPGSRTHYRAQRDFGGGLTYTAIAITAAHMAEHEAWSSYAGAVQPENLVTA